MADLLVHSDVLVDHLRGARRLQPGPDRLSYSAVTRFDLFASEDADERRIQRLLSPFQELSLDRRVAERAGRLLRDTSLAAADALIAATAIVHRMPLVTAETKEFGGIDGLEVRSPLALGDPVEWGPA